MASMVLLVELLGLMWRAMLYSSVGDSVGSVSVEWGIVIQMINRLWVNGIFCSGFSRPLTGLININILIYWSWSAEIVHWCFSVTNVKNYFQTANYRCWAEPPHFKLEGYAKGNDGSYTVTHSDKHCFCTEKGFFGVRLNIPV
jgi:hypothetical protein